MSCISSPFCAVSINISLGPGREADLQVDREGIAAISSSPYNPSDLSFRGEYGVGVERIRQKTGSDRACDDSQRYRRALPYI
jgi:hypothetical protein